MGDTDSNLTKNAILFLVKKQAWHIILFYRRYNFFAGTLEIERFDDCYRYPIIRCKYVHNYTHLVGVS